MSNLERIIRQAIGTFSKVQSLSQFQENLNSLKQNFSKLTLKDVSLDKETILAQNVGDKTNPVLHIHVYEDLNILVTIFILKSNSVIPLHDHPLMHGILKVLSGSASIQSYSVLSNNIKQRDVRESKYCPNDYYVVESNKLYSKHIPVRKSAPVILNENDSCAVLTPTENNIHEVRSFNGPSAFIDILTPPYYTDVCNIGVRRCTYFFEEKESRTENTHLSISLCESRYWTTDVPFKGPKIRID